LNACARMLLSALILCRWHPWLLHHPRFHASMLTLVSVNRTHSTQHNAIAWTPLQESELRTRLPHLSAAANYASPIRASSTIAGAASPKSSFAQDSSPLLFAPLPPWSKTAFARTLQSLLVRPLALDKLATALTLSPRF
jgi:hypothetical protein